MFVFKEKEGCDLEKLAEIYSGKAKKLFQTTQENILLVEYLNQATALNGLRKDTVEGKAMLNNQISAHIYQYLNQKGHKTHFVEEVSPTQQLVQALTIIPIEVVLRNITAGSFSKRFGIEEGIPLDKPIIEFYYKSDALDDPFINEDHVAFLAIASLKEIATIKEMTLAINESLKDYFKQLDIILVDFKLEFGKDQDGNIVLADEISPDTCRLWDKNIHEQLDKDVYRRDLGDLVSVYQEVLNRIQAL